MDSCSDQVLFVRDSEPAIGGAGGEQHSTQIAGYTHQALAERIGTYRESVSVALADLRSAGAVALERERIQILDMELLQTIAEQSDEGPRLAKAR